MKIVWSVEWLYESFKIKRTKYILHEVYFQYPQFEPLFELGLVVGILNLVVE